MPDLSFQVESAEPVPFAAAPLLSLKLRVTDANPAQRIHTVALRAQIQIDAARRRYNRSGAGALARPLRRARPLEPHPPLHALDPRQRRPALVYRQHRGRISKSPAPSTSTSPPPNISTASPKAKSR